jgi:hypothetical protein
MTSASRPRDAKSASVVHEIEGVLPRDALSVSVACDAKSASAACEVEVDLRRDAKSACVDDVSYSVLDRRDAKSVSVARDAERFGVLPRDAKSVSGVSVAHEVDGVLPRDAKSVSVLVAHEVEGVPIRDARSVSAARDAEGASVAHNVEGVLRRDAKRVSEGVLLRDARCASVACDAESVSVSHEVEGVLCRDAERSPVAHEVPKRSASRRTEMGRMTSASRPRDAKSVSVVHEIEGVLPRDALSVSVACDAKSASAACEVEVDLCRDAKSACVDDVSYSVLDRHDAKSVSVARDAESTSVALVVEGVSRHDAKSVSGDVAAPECMSKCVAAMSQFDLDGLFAEVSAAAAVGATLPACFRVCISGWLRCFDDIGQSLLDPLFDELLNDVAIHNCCTSLDLCSSEPRDSCVDSDSLRRERACRRICCLAPGVFDRKCQQALEEGWLEEDFLEWWRGKLFDPMDQGVEREFVQCFMRKLWHEDSEAFLHDWPYWSLHHAT